MGSPRPVYPWHSPEARQTEPIRSGWNVSAVQWQLVRFALLYYCAHSRGLGVQQRRASPDSDALRRGSEAISKLTSTASCTWSTRSDLMTVLNPSFSTSTRYVRGDRF